MIPLPRATLPQVTLYQSRHQVGKVHQDKRCKKLGNLLEQKLSRIVKDDHVAVSSTPCGVCTDESLAVLGEVHQVNEAATYYEKLLQKTRTPLQYLILLAHLQLATRGSWYLFLPGAPRAGQTVNDPVAVAAWGRVQAALEPYYQTILKTVNDPAWRDELLALIPGEDTGPEHLLVVVGHRGYHLHDYTSGHEITNQGTKMVVLHYLTGHLEEPLGGLAWARVSDGVTRWLLEGDPVDPLGYEYLYSQEVAHTDTDTILETAAGLFQVGAKGQLGALKGALQAARMLAT